MADTIVKLFLENAERNPKAPALLDIRGTYSYEEMNRRSAYLAEKILSAAGGKRVAVLLPRIKDFVVAMFAVLRAGGAVVPIDGEYPVERVRSILQDVNCALCFTTKARAGEIEEVPSLLLEEIFPEGEDVPEADLTLDLSDPDAEGYILYTSGSTGKPKGMVHRQSILSCAPTVFAGQIPMTAHSRALNIAGVSFIASLVDFTTMLSCGGSVYMANETERKNMEMIHGLFTKRKITGMFCPPQMYGVLQKLYGNPPLEYVILAGEKAQGSEYPPGVLEAYGSSENFFALLHSVASNLVTLMMNSQLLRYLGEMGVAAMGVYDYVSEFFLAVMFGISSTAITVVGYKYGEKDRNELDSLVKNNTVLTLFFGAGLCLLFTLCAEPVARIYVGYNAETCALTTKALRIMALGCIVFGFNLFVSSFFTGMGNGLVSAIISFCGSLIAPLAMMFAVPAIFGGEAIWYALPLSMMITTGVCIICLHKAYYQKKELW